MEQTVIFASNPVAMTWNFEDSYSILLLDTPNSADKWTYRVQ